MPLHKDDHKITESTKLVCVTACPWNGRRWKIGMVYNAKPGDYIPHHFKLMDGDGKPVEKTVEEDQTEAYDSRAKSHECPHCGAALKGKNVELSLRAHKRFCKSWPDGE